MVSRLLLAEQFANYASTISSITSTTLATANNFTTVTYGNGLDCSAEPIRYGIWEKTLILIAAVLFSAATVIGNIMVMISFKMDKNLQTPSNYFLFSLAVADFCVGLFSMPLFTMYTLLGYWPLGSFLCDSWLALDYLVSNASVLNLMLISFDRYFSILYPLIYRIRRTTSKALMMIAGAWGISAALWPPWIFAWPYIEGQRTVPPRSCYIQFIETNHYITLVTAIIAFYIPVTVMIVLYSRIWAETKKREKELPSLQGGANSSSIKRSCNDDRDMQVRKRSRSDSNTEIHTYQVSKEYQIYNYAEFSDTSKMFSWSRVRLWCVTWLNSGEEEMYDDIEACNPEYRRRQIGYEQAYTHATEEIPSTSTATNCDSATQMNSPKTDSNKTSVAFRKSDNPCKTGAIDDSVYTILIQIPTRDSNSGSRYNEERLSIRMFCEDEVTPQSLCPKEDQKIVANTSSSGSRSSQTQDARTPLNAKDIPKTSTGGRGIFKRRAIQKMKKKTPEKKADGKAARTLTAILMAFVITWTPYNILVLVKSISGCSVYIPQQLWDFVYYLCYLNSTLNPVCYALCNTSFRSTYMRILRCQWRAINRATAHFTNRR